MAMRFVLDQAPWLHEDNIQPLLVQGQVFLCVGEVAINIGEGGHQQPVQDRWTFLVVLLVEAGRTQPDNGGESGLRVRHSDVHQSDDDGLGGVLGDVNVGHVVIARNGRKDGIGALETWLDDGCVAEVSGEYLDVGVGCNVGGLLQQLRFRAYVDVDLILRVLYKQFQHITPCGTCGPEDSIARHDEVGELVYSVNLEFEGVVLGQLLTRDGFAVEMLWRWRAEWTMCRMERAGAGWKAEGAEWRDWNEVNEMSIYSMTRIRVKPRCPR